ncbi:hypothetical protein QCA50_014244 [Cerrena zonata]|uniref:Uncharacterized protein n=1 Tax=Cerrena zonata TaxID=2478898 RepID=A0AAW0FP98_9APHY
MTPIDLGRRGNRDQNWSNRASEESALERQTCEIGVEAVVAEAGAMSTAQEGTGRSWGWVTTETTNN